MPSCRTRPCEIVAWSKELRRKSVVRIAACRSACEVVAQLMLYLYSARLRRGTIYQPLLLQRCWSVTVLRPIVSLRLAELHCPAMFPKNPYFTGWNQHNNQQHSPTFHTSATNIGFVHISYDQHAFIRSQQGYL